MKEGYYRSEFEEQSKDIANFQPINYYLDSSSETYFWHGRPRFTLSVQYHMHPML